MCWRPDSRLLGAVPVAFRDAANDPEDAWKIFKHLESEDRVSRSATPSMSQMVDKKIQRLHERPNTIMLLVHTI